MIYKRSRYYKELILSNSAIEEKLDNIFAQGSSSSSRNRNEGFVELEKVL